MDLLKAVNLSKTYGNGQTAVDALKNINMIVNKNEFISVVGPSGSGKSTLLQILGGLNKPTTGEVIFEGKNIYSLSENELSMHRRRKFGFVFQSYNLIPVLTVEENIMLPLQLDNKQIDKSYIAELIELLGLTERKNFLPNALSGGQQQRVAIGRALANMPSVVFADEPTGNLDRKTGREVLDLFHLFADKYKKTIVIITHDLNIADESDKVYRVEDGNLTDNKVMIR